MPQRRPWSRLDSVGTWGQDRSDRDDVVASSGSTQARPKELSPRGAGPGDAGVGPDLSVRDHAVELLDPEVIAGQALGAVLAQDVLEAVGHQAVGVTGAVALVEAGRRDGAPAEVEQVEVNEFPQD